MDKYLYQRDAVGMELLLIMAALILLDVLAARYGYDSRVLDPRRHVRWWPAE